MRILLAIAVVALVTFAAPAEAQPAALPTIEAFAAREPALRSVALSPNGAYVAYIRRVEAGDQLVVLDLATNQGQAIQSVTHAQGARMLWADWKTDDRLIVGASLTQGVSGRAGATGSRFGGSDGYDFTISRVFSIARTGGAIVEMFDDQSRFLVGGIGSTFLLDALAADPDHVLLVATDNNGVGVWRASITTGRAERVSDGSFNTRLWAADGTGQPVMRMDLVSSGYKILRRAPGERGWIEHSEVRRGATATNSPDFSIVGAGPGLGQVYVLARPDNTDLLGLYLFDTATGQLSAPLQEGVAADVGMPEIHVATREVFMRCEWAARRTCSAADRDVDRHLRAVQSFLGADVNVTIAGMSRDASIWLVHAIGPGQPGAYYVYSRANTHVRPLASIYPQAPIDALQRTEVINYQARDGASLWAYVTAQPGQGPRPMVVMPHGGPEARDYFAYDFYAQFLASRGYVVVQPNFRGSGGFGRAFADAGRGQWGRLMQDDVTDVVRHMVDAGIADANRICIVGASYGGYAALAGITLTPDLYRCAISISGVSDLVRSMRDEHAEGGPSSLSYYYWRRSIGDPARDRDALRAVSPALLADRVTVPVLLMHGDADTIVPFEQSEIMQRALQQAGKPTRLVRLEDAGHIWDEWTEEQRRTLLRETEAFLAQNLAPR